MDHPRLSHPDAIGQPYARIDGPAKVSGAAGYAADFMLPGMLYAVPVCATIAHGRITGLDTEAAQAMPGVHTVLHQGNRPPLYRAASGSIDEARPPLDDDIVRYYGQYVALVVADTLEQAQAAASAVQVSYDAQAPDVSPPADEDTPTVESERGDAPAAYASAPVQFDAVYTTPVETHNSIELHACVADYDGQAYTLYETSQGVVNHRDVVAQMLGTGKEHVRVISRYLGSGFGGKLWPWSHSLLAPVAARLLGRPVKLVLSRAMTFHSAGHRPYTRQRIRLGATPEGRLVSLQHHYLSQVSMLDKYREKCGEATPRMYSTPNLKVCWGLARRHVGAPTSMRGPGAVPGMYALESAMDELAVALDIDPVELRLRNEPEHDEGVGLPFSSRHLRECLQQGAERFGWQRRQAGVGAMRQGEEVLGWGMASCSWLALRMPTDATVTLHADGSARLVCATQDIGTGTYTVLAQLVSAETGIGLDRIQVGLGDTQLPPGPISGGSAATASFIPAALEATRNAVQAACKLAVRPQGPYAGKSAKELAVLAGRLRVAADRADAGVPLAQVLKAAGVASVSGDGHAGSGKALKKQYSINSYGAHFVEIAWHPATVRLRVSRVVTVIDGGRILNTRTGRNQIEGAIVMGVGMAMLEHTHYDSRSGAPVNSNLADYIVATHADAPRLDVSFLDYPDYIWNEVGARGIGEIGLAGIAAAITNAVYHATGVRVRDLPVRIEDLL
ncbi:xanthine dehydrogenase family protein molybdopterin-binding subunit [Bordetella sp. BOR01]|uniref:xanthine dehydrogenase family protein molybdopterin-binding subunit n=1 Tax=Bordetella sp. BOR01 TaxID=2854779 RepID=UPI001C464539|nr:xanthine dehydrogenase family protein molybdopterin-binding subunit [Bordetella sp. BOR01]MBV7483745.1 xanthine dehydrogenase family protein molybdopterin-binding subunit [Bordetella sp. BOR01]